MLGWSVAALLYTPSIVRAPEELVMLPALQNDVEDWPPIPSVLFV